MEECGVLENLMHQIVHLLAISESQAVKTVKITGYVN